MRATHTYAVLEVTHGAFEEIRAKLEAAGYTHAFSQDGGRTAIDMHGIAVAPEPAGVPEKAEATPWKPIDTAPRDGTWVLIGWFALPGQTSMDVAFWHSTLGAWCQTHRAFTKNAAWQPTHWTALPALPKRRECAHGLFADACSVCDTEFTELTAFIQPPGASNGSDKASWTALVCRECGRTKEHGHAVDCDRALHGRDK